MRLLLKSATIIDTDSPFHLKTKDIFIVNNCIHSIEDHIEADGDKVIELENLHVSPGWFDSSVSFGEPGFEDRETLANGMDTAMKSGFTKIVLNPNTDPVIDHSALVQFVNTKNEKHLIDIFPSGALTVKSKSKSLAELFDMHQNGAVAFGDYKKSISNTNLLKIGLQYTKTFEGLIQLYPIDNNLSKDFQMHEAKMSTSLGLKGLPNMAEVIQLKRDLEVIKYTSGKAHFVCISTAESVDLIRNAKADGLDVTCSVAIPHLIFTDSCLKDFDTKYKIWPPLREQSDQEALIEGLHDGTIDMVTTDHNPINIELKKTEFENAAFGSIGLESAFGALNNSFGLEHSVDFLTRGKNRFKQPRNTIEPKQIADLTLFNPDNEYTFSLKDISSKSKNSIFLGEKLKGKVYGIINNEKYYVSGTK